MSFKIANNVPLQNTMLLISKNAVYLYIFIKKKNADSVLLGNFINSFI